LRQENTDNSEKEKRNRSSRGFALNQVSGDCRADDLVAPTVRQVFAGTLVW
jgi:hypothetical protein